MPVISMFFGIVVRMFYADHSPPHIHVEYHGQKAVFDFQGNIIKGEIKSRTAVKLIREWIDLRLDELTTDWELARQGKEIKTISPLD